jgi:hypothetical protein
MFRAIGGLTAAMLMPFSVMLRMASSGKKATPSPLATSAATAAQSFAR